MDEHTYPYLSLFKSYVPDLGSPDSNGWASGSCPFCGEADTFRVNLKSGRWVCLPTPGQNGRSREGDSHVDRLAQQLGEKK
jgi:hypothetical protein